jgi:hypothetical protein
MKDYLPCQAADLAAYECLHFRRAFKELASGQKPLRGSLLALFGKVPGQYMLADEPSLRDLCNIMGIQKRTSSGL